MTSGGTALYIRARKGRPKNTHKIHFGVSGGFVYLGATIKEKYSHLKLNQYDETNSKLSTNACIQW